MFKNEKLKLQNSITNTLNLEMSYIKDYFLNRGLGTGRVGRGAPTPATKLLTYDTFLLGILLLGTTLIALIKQIVDFTSKVKRKSHFAF
tara:strand:- start:250 stop:516 length:267 start_codon:yes stop_codon:yes gene_type:complete